MGRGFWLRESWNAFRRPCKRRRARKGAKPRRPDDRTTDQLRTGGEPQDCHGARRRSADIAAAARRRGDRMTMLFAAMHESVVGVRRAKTALSSGCKSHPATAPAGSNRSSHGGNEVAEAFD